MTLESFVQFMRAALVCAVFVVVIFTLPVLMAGTPYRIGVLFNASGSGVTQHWDSAIAREPRTSD
jgi:hypothetical protein